MREKEREERREGRGRISSTSPRLAVRPRSIKTSPSLIYRTTLIAVPLKEGVRAPLAIPSSELLQKL